MKVLLVESDPEQLDIAAFILRREGFVVVNASDQAQALTRFRLEGPDIVVVGLDILVSEGDELLRRVRAEGRTPVLVTVGRDNRPAVLRGLELGADDFISMPYMSQEIVLRVQAMLRRATHAAHEPEVPLEIGDLRLDPEAHMAVRGSLQVRLTPTEFRICYALMKNADRVVPANRLLTFVRSSDGGAANSLRSHISHLRRKLALDGGVHGSIASIPAVGYVFRGPRESDVDTPGGLGLPQVAAGS